MATLLTSLHNSESQAELLSMSGEHVREGGVLGTVKKGWQGLETYQASVHVVSLSVALNESQSQT